ILGALFFSVTFILNRSMELDGGSWVWRASLRFIFMLLILLIIVGWRRDIQPVWAHLKQHPAAWLVWSMVGFGLFYAPLTFSTYHCRLASRYTTSMGPSETTSCSLARLEYGRFWTFLCSNDFCYYLWTWMACCCNFSINYYSGVITRSTLE